MHPDPPIHRLSPKKLSGARLACRERDPARGASGRQGGRGREKHGFRTPTRKVGTKTTWRIRSACKSGVNPAASDPKWLRARWPYRPTTAFTAPTLARSRPLPGPPRRTAPCELHGRRPRDLVLLPVHALYAPPHGPPLRVASTATLAPRPSSTAPEKRGLAHHRAARGPVRAQLVARSHCHRGAKVAQAAPVPLFGSALVTP